MNQDRFIKRIKLSQEILQKIGKIDECKGLWHGGLRLSPQILGNLKRTVIITSTGASTRIEGARMDDDEIARLLRGLKTQSPRNRDEQEVAGYADLIGRVFDHWQSLKLTEGQILQFHSILLRFSKKDQRHKGAYKKADNVVVARTPAGVQKILFRPTPPYLVKKEMDDVLYWTSDQLSKGVLHHLLIIFNFVFEFLAIHPFEDGNGRLSRALTNLLLLKSGYSYVPYVSLEKIIEDRVLEYYLSLRATQKNHKSAHEDITPWVDFSLDMLIIQANQALSLMEKAQPEKLLSEKQRMIFELFKSRDELSVAEIYQAHNTKVSRATIKQALGRLTGLKLIERFGEGRGSRYRLFMANK